MNLILYSFKASNFTDIAVYFKKFVTQRCAEPAEVKMNESKSKNTQF